MILTLNPDCFKGTPLFDVDVKYIRNSTR